MLLSTLFILEVRFAAHLRDICTVFTSVCGHRAYFLLVWEVRFSHTSVRSAHFLPQRMRFGGAADFGLYSTE